MLRHGVGGSAKVGDILLSITTGLSQLSIEQSLVQEIDIPCRVNENFYRLNHLWSE